MADDEHEKLNPYQTIQHLQEENRQLRKAAASFGQLAERLNEALIRERRLAQSDRRRKARPGTERRSPSND